MKGETRMLSLNAADFKDKVSGSTKLTVVDYGANWCGPCKKLKPVLEDLANTYLDKVDFYYVDAGEQPGMAQENGVMSLPTMLFFKNGQVKDRIIGLVSKEKIIEKIEALK